VKSHKLKEEDTKVVRLRPDPVSAEILEELADHVRNNRIESMVIMATKPYETEEERKKHGGPGTVYQYWYSEGQFGSVTMLGLVEYLKGIIKKYIIDGIDICRGEED
jgi:hypothetical protein